MIARPFEGEPGHFKRTADRHDYAVPPPDGMLLDQLAARGVPVYAVGKISDIFQGRGITHSVNTKNNDDGMEKTMEAMRDQHNGLIFVNLVDFDQLYGHRNDVDGYARALEAVDRCDPRIFDLQPNDLLILTADHGCDPDPRWETTDHSREYVPILAYSTAQTSGNNLGTRATLADMGQSIAENFGTKIPHGTSFLPHLH